MPSKDAQLCDLYLRLLWLVPRCLEQRKNQLLDDTEALYGKKLDNRDIVTTAIAITGCDETAGAADLVSLHA